MIEYYIGSVSKIFGHDTIVVTNKLVLLSESLFEEGWILMSGKDEKFDELWITPLKSVKKLQCF
ncbi:hypothetical protein CMI47_13055 [Candidatus Pacearchaeota archaeon]|nr:hypothetical protein [Candidatus Pacearchaeota archaeon]|tara:strand:- start:1483 stop:1674 length:192 start_codon:yes stop_codon:yes gene_type:complete